GILVLGAPSHRRAFRKLIRSTAMCWSLADCHITMMMLPSPRPRRTVRTRHRVHGSSHRRTPERRTGAVNLPMAVRVHNAQTREVIRATMLLGKHIMHVQVLVVFEYLQADGTAALLPSMGLRVDRQTPSGGP